MDLGARPFPARASAVAARGMVATSQPLATQAGLRALERGGNADRRGARGGRGALRRRADVDRRRRRLLRARLARRRADGAQFQRARAGLRRPRRHGERDPDARPAQHHRARRRRRLGGARRAPRPPRPRRRARRRDRHRRARVRRHARDRRSAGPRRRPTSRGSRRRAASSCRRRASASSCGSPSSPATLRRIAQEGAGGLLPRARRAMPSARSRRSRSTTSPHPHADWVEPLRRHYRGVDVCEIPPNGQGVAALQALGILGDLDHTGGSPLDRVHLQAEAMKLAFADAERYVHDGPLPSALPGRRLPRGAAGADRPGARRCARWRARSSRAARSTCARWTRTATRAR